VASEGSSAYRALLERLDRWFAESASRHPGVVPCRAGCSACCHGPFDISIADAALLVEAVNRLPPDELAEVEYRAGAQVARMRSLAPGWNPDEGLAGIPEEEFDRVGDAMAGEPCPLLDDRGQCRVYGSRPLVCRMIGLGMVTPLGRRVENACPIASSFPGYPDLEPQLFDLESLEERERACLEAASAELLGDPGGAGFETTIAGAVVRFV
jgi:Fe-S-cluster containining protein